ncbi:MAG: hypothetical protein AB1589_14690 [Cyanobacteriota bacterium]
MCIFLLIDNALFVFGGILHTRMDAESPGDEFQIAGIDPLASFLFAGLFGLIGWWEYFTVRAL